MAIQGRLWPGRDRVGFTGTRLGMTREQHDTVEALLLEMRPSLLVHGGCLGADDEVDRIAVSLGIKRWVMPSTIPDRSIPTRVLIGRDPTVVIDAPDQPLRRNQSIVNGCEVLIACPSETDERLRSGTWAAIRYGRKVKRRTVLIGPDGKTFVAGELYPHRPRP